MEQALKRLLKRNWEEPASRVIDYCIDIERKLYDLTWTDMRKTAYQSEKV